MCDCTSCKETDRYANAGFAKWPTGEPKGKRTSEAEYRAHTAHVWKGARKTLNLGSPFPCTGTTALDPHGHYQFEGSAYTKNYSTKYRELPEDPRAYAAQWAELNHLTVEALPKRAKLRKAA